MTTPHHTPTGSSPPLRRDTADRRAGAEVLHIAGLSAASGRSSPMTTSRCACAAATCGAAGPQRRRQDDPGLPARGTAAPARRADRVGGADACDPPPPAAGWRCKPQAHAPLDGLTPRAAIEIAARLRKERLNGRAAPPPRPSRTSSTSHSGWTVGRCRTGRGSRAACGAWPPSRWRSPPPPLCWCSTSRPATWTPRGGCCGGGAASRGCRGRGAAGDPQRRRGRAHRRRAGDPRPRPGGGHRDAGRAARRARRDLRLELRGAAQEPAGRGPRPRRAEGRQRSRRGHTDVLTISAQDASAAVAWAQALREVHAIEDYSLCPATLEDVYLAHTAPDPAGTDPSEETPHV